jgi:glycosyltransferase involved in cell wall biosynthesis
MAKIAVLIPALNCERTIAPAVGGALAHADRVLVVDDGSSDSTAELARQAGAEVISHGQCQGKGAALMTGFARLAALGVEHAVTMDGDGQHLPGEIPKLVVASAAQPAAIVIGARSLEQVEIAPIKLFGNQFANRWVEIACGQRIADTQSGFRVYPLAATLALGLRARRFAFETEVLVRGVRAGMPIVSVPVGVYYPPVAERTSHFRPVADTVRIIAVVVGLILRLW